MRMKDHRRIGCLIGNILVKVNAWTVLVPLIEVAQPLEVREMG